MALSSCDWTEWCVIINRSVYFHLCLLFLLGTFSTFFANMFWSSLTSMFLIIFFAGFWSGTLGQTGELPSNIDYNTSSVIYGSYSIEGKVLNPEKATPPKNFLINTKVIVNYGQYSGFLKWARITLYFNNIVIFMIFLCLDPMEHSR